MPCSILHVPEYCKPERWASQLQDYRKVENIQGSTDIVVGHTRMTVYLLSMLVGPGSASMSLLWLLVVLPGQVRLPSRVSLILLCVTSAKTLVVKIIWPFALAAIAACIYIV